MIQLIFEYGEYNIYPPSVEYVALWWSAVFWLQCCCNLVTKSCLTFGTPWTVAHQVPLSMGLPRQEHWSGSPFPPLRDLPNLGIESKSPELPADSFSGSASGKEPACQCRRHNRCRLDPWVGKISWRREWQPTAVLLPGKSHGQRSLEGYTPQGLK